jgi:hypothetical protein
VFHFAVCFGDARVRGEPAGTGHPALASTPGCAAPGSRA